MLGSGRLSPPASSTLPADEASALVWRDCQRIAICTGCRPVYKCRSCSYKRTCAGGVCGWGDVCVWGPYVKVLPRGARIIRYVLPRTASFAWWHNGQSFPTDALLIWAGVMATVPAS